MSTLDQKKIDKNLVDDVEREAQNNRRITQFWIHGSKAQSHRSRGDDEAYSPHVDGQQVRVELEAGETKLEDVGDGSGGLL